LHMKNLALGLLIGLFCLSLLILLGCGGAIPPAHLLGRNLHNHPFFIGLILLPWAVVSNMGRHRLGLLKQNFKGKAVMSAYGIDAFGYIAILAAVKVVFHPGAKSDHIVTLFVAVMAAMWALGLIDDVEGNSEAKGLRGHLRELLLHRRPTTGAVKAIGGVVTGFVYGVAVCNGDRNVLVQATLLIPLASNAINVLDVRPGRACGAFLLAMFLLVGSGLFRHNGDPFVVAALLVVAVAWLYMDAPGAAMMGDSGSNMLGALLGAYIALNGGPIERVSAIAVLFAVNIYAEIRSISELVESKPWLRWLDAQLGVR
jgi:UDP-GlcNAc:undecaprenyl-phosphate/decaprenyl-phosphate GlcNAc-1-phosphate transferase